MARAKRKQTEVNFYTYEKIKIMYDIMERGTQIPSEYSFLLGNDIWYVEEHFLVTTNHGTVIFDDKSYLIQQLNGELYPCEISLFKEIYDEVI